MNKYLLLRNKYIYEIIIFSVYFLLTVFNYNFYLTNEYTPGGDGTRIYQYLKYLEKVPEIIPFWNGHKNHGYPLIADPENHMLWSWLLDTESPYFNICLNMVFFLLAALFAYTCRSIAKTLGLSNIASFVVGSVLILCVPIARQLMHGSISSIVNRLLIYISIAIIVHYIAGKDRSKYYLLLFVPFVLAWAVRNGYYFPINFHIPAFAFLLCIYIKHGETYREASKKAFFVLLFVTCFMVLFSLPFSLPILDGIYLSKTFLTQTPIITISDKDVFNFYLGLWPFVLFALTYCKGLLLNYSYIFLGVACINFLLILFNGIGFDAFFDVWSQTPIVKNIRWQHAFRELSSISAAFCLGFFLDSCNKQCSKKQVYFYVLFVLSLFSIVCVMYFQCVRDVSYYMRSATLLLICMLIFGNRRNVVITLYVVLFVVLSINFTVSPIKDKFYKTTDKQVFKDYKGTYFWWNGTGLDRFSPVLKQGTFSLVFLEEYRMLLELLYKQKITAQRPHWIGKIDKVNFKVQNPAIADLMSICRPVKSLKNCSDFRVYDDWIVADKKETIHLLADKEFSVDSPIIIEESPLLAKGSDDLQLDSKVELTKKTADRISFEVITNKNSILFVPEMYHRDWMVTVNGSRQKIIKAYSSMRAVAIGPGVNTVDMVFRYRPFYFGVSVAFVAFFVLLRFSMSSFGRKMYGKFLPLNK